MSRDKWWVPIVVALISAVSGFGVAIVGVPRTVTVTVTSNSFNTVPNVIGENVRTAQKDVSNGGFVPNPLPKPTTQYPYEQVFDQHPSGGTRYPVNSVVDLVFSAGNQTYPNFLDIFWGDKIAWGEQGFQIRGELANPTSLGNRSLYLILHAPSSYSFWVQDKPNIFPDSTWVATVTYGLGDLQVGSNFILYAIVTPETLTPGQKLSSLPRADAVLPTELYLGDITGGKFTYSNSTLFPNQTVIPNGIQQPVQTMTRGQSAVLAMTIGVIAAINLQSLNHRLKRKCPR